MLKRVFSLTGLTMILVILLAGCAVDNPSPGNSNDIKASLGQQFTLPVGKTATMNGENLAIKFETVTADSRCPTGVQCIWAGEAKCQMQVTYQGSVSTVVFTMPGGSEGKAENFINGYSASFNLEPYPDVSKQLDPNSYKLVMTITK